MQNLVSHSYGTSTVVDTDYIESKNLRCLDSIQIRGSLRETVPFHWVNWVGKLT